MLTFILNLPYTLIGLVIGIISLPTKVGIKKDSHFVIIVQVKSFWWAMGFMKGARAMAIGHTILLSPKIEDRDFEHELVHVQQYDKAPLI